MASALGDANDGRQFEALYERLRAGVLRGELAPGSWVSQAELARTLQISRSPLRETLRMLQREGLIEAETGKRSRIADVSAPDVDQLYAMRIAIEALAVRLTVGTASAVRVAEIERQLEEMSTFQDSRDFEAWEAPHRAFHVSLVSGAGARLLATISDLSDHAERYRRIFLKEPRAWSSAAAEHAAIFEAFAAGDARRTASELASHLAKTALTVAATMAPEYEPARVREALSLVTSNRDGGPVGP